MEFTFGICTDGKNDLRILQIIESIRKQKIPKYEILIVGNSNIESVKDVIVFPFDEQEKDSWITRKKNLLVDYAQYENLVFLHDYIILEDGWYEGWLRFGNNFVAGMNIVLNENGNRYRDWCLLHHYFPWDGVDMGFPLEIGRFCLIPYSESRLSKWMYFSGAYWVAKTWLMKEIPLNESRSWGEGEDVTWSYQVTRRYRLSMNPFSKVRLLKYKDPIYQEMSWKMYEDLILPFCSTLIKPLPYNSEGTPEDLQVLQVPTSYPHQRS